MNKRSFLKSLGLMAATGPLFSLDFAKENANTTLLPKALLRGQTVGIISPSAASADRMEYTFAKEAMEAMGLKVKLGANFKNRYGFPINPLNPFCHYWKIKNTPNLAKLISGNICQISYIFR